MVWCIVGMALERKGPLHQMVNRLDIMLPGKLFTQFIRRIHSTRSPVAGSVVQALPSSVKPYLNPDRADVRHSPTGEPLTLSGPARQARCSTPAALARVRAPLFLCYAFLCITVFYQYFEIKLLSRIFIHRHHPCYECSQWHRDMLTAWVVNIEIIRRIIKIRQ